MQFNKSELYSAIDNLPTYIEGDKTTTIHGVEGDYVLNPVMRQWTTLLPLRHQGVLTSALRDCDGAPKDDLSKGLTKMIRRAILNPADARETKFAGGFFGFDAAVLKVQLIEFIHSKDQYPLHYVTHLMHACEVIAYKHHDVRFRVFFHMAYSALVHGFHLHPETEKEMDNRLTFDRVAAGTVERDLA